MIYKITYEKYLLNVRHSEVSVPYIVKLVLRVSHIFTSCISFLAVFYNVLVLSLIHVVNFFNGLFFSYLGFFMFKINKYLSSLSQRLVVRKPSSIFLSSN